MGNYRKLWFALIGVLVLTFSLLGYYGAEVYRSAPPIPQKVVSADGVTLFTRRKAFSTVRLRGNRSAACSSVRSGGTVPIRRPTGLPTGCTANSSRGSTSPLSSSTARRSRRWMPTRRHCCVPGSSANTAATPSMPKRERPPYRRCAPQRSPAPPTTTSRLFGADPALQGTRESYAMKENTLPDAERREKMTGFFFWTAWAASTERPPVPAPPTPTTGRTSR
jgi:nitric oxide reductase subunit B